MSLPTNESLTDLQKRRRAARDRERALPMKPTASLDNDEQRMMAALEASQQNRETSRAEISEHRRRLRATTEDSALSEEIRDEWAQTARSGVAFGKEALRREDALPHAPEFDRHVAHNVGRAASEIRENEARLKTLARKELALLLAQKGKGSLAVHDLKKVQDRQLDVQQALADIRGASPEGHFVYNARLLKQYREQLARGELVATPYVKKEMNVVNDALDLGQPVIIAGHLGSGKTELAKQIVAERYTRFHPETAGIRYQPHVIPGAKHSTERDLLGRTKLETQGPTMADLDQFKEFIDARMNVWRDAHPEANDHEINREHSSLLKIYLTKFNSSTVTRFFIGPIYRAMEEGSVVIIDEFNTIPAEVLVVLNDLITRQPGDEVWVEQNGGSKIKVKEGFGVIMTGNLVAGTVKYEGTQDMNPAFLSRFKKINYNYLPNSKDSTILHSNEGDELFQVMLAKLSNPNGTITMPEGSFEKLYALAKLARISTDAFSGQSTDPAYNMHLSGMTQAGERPKLKKAVLSMRAILKIIDRWQTSGFRGSLDSCLYNEFIQETDQDAPSDSRYHYQMARDRCGFFKKEDGWPEVVFDRESYMKPLGIAAPDDAAESLKPASVQARIAAKRAGTSVTGTRRRPSPKLVTSSLREVVQKGFGKPDERYEYPNYSEMPVAPVTPEQKDTDNERELFALETFLKEEQAKIPDFIEKIRQVCALEGETCTL